MSFDKIFDLTAGMYFHFYNNFFLKDVNREFDELLANIHICKLRCWYLQSIILVGLDIRQKVWLSKASAMFLLPRKDQYNFTSSNRSAPHKSRISVRSYS